MSLSFSLDQDINKYTKMADSLDKAPKMRWERKLAEAVRCVNIDGNKSTTEKTPTRSYNIQPLADHSSRNSIKKSPQKRKSPGNHFTPSRSQSVGDRYIPNRSTTQFELGHFLLNKSNSQSKLLDDDVFTSPSALQYQKNMSENLNGGDVQNFKIINYHQKQPEPKYGFNRESRPLFNGCRNPTSTSKPARHIPSAPERILDAPDILDDYYLNLLDWSCDNILAVSLGQCLYLWNATTSDIQVLMELPSPNDYICSVAWIAEGNYLAVGTNNCDVQIWDVEKKKKLRSMNGHTARVGCLSWNEHILSSGSRSGYISHHDVRVSQHLVSSAQAHSQEVCGLKWSWDGRYLASGGNDNIVNIFPAVGHQKSAELTPIYSFTDHIAAVKAVAWCPWQHSLLATGAGTLDKQMRFWNCNTGTCLANVNTNSQVCSILWSKDYKELVSSHGYELNQLTIWSYPKLERITELTGHTSRVLYMAMSPDGSTIVSAAADETLRLWKCFASDSGKTKAPSKTSLEKPASISLLSKIR